VRRAAWSRRSHACARHGPLRRSTHDFNWLLVFISDALELVEGPARIIRRASGRTRCSVRRRSGPSVEHTTRVRSASRVFEARANRVPVCVLHQRSKNTTRPRSADLMARVRQGQSSHTIARPSTRTIIVAFHTWGGVRRRARRVFRRAIVRPQPRNTRSRCVIVRRVSTPGRHPQPAITQGHGCRACV